MISSSDKQTLADGILDYLRDWVIQNDINPNDLFDNEALDEWATDNAYFTQADIDTAVAAAKEQ